MRRVSARSRQRSDSSRRKRAGAALGAVAMHDVRAQSRQSVAHSRPARNDRSGMRQPMDRQAQQRVPGAGDSVASCCRPSRRRSMRIRDQADLMTARDLLVRKIEHMAEQAADRRAQHMHDAQGPRRPVGLAASSALLLRCTALRVSKSRGRRFACGLAKLLDSSQP